VLRKIAPTGEKLLAFSTLVLPLGIPVTLAYVLLKMFHHLKTLWTLAPQVKMDRANVFIQCSSCCTPGVTLVAGEVLHFKVDKLAVAVQVLNLLPTVRTSLLHAKVHSL